MERNQFCNFGRGHIGEHSCEVILNMDQWFRRRCRLKKKFTNGRMHDGRRPITTAHRETFGSGELKIGFTLHVYFVGLTADFFI